MLEKVKVESKLRKKCRLRAEGASGFFWNPRVECQEIMQQTPLNPFHLPASNRLRFSMKFDNGKVPNSAASVHAML